MITYTLHDDPLGITCLLCGMTSHHPKDVQHHYCANCHRFHDDWQHTVDSKLYLRLLACVQLCYRKHHLDDPALGWSDVDDVLQTTLAEVMGDVGFHHWLHTTAAQIDVQWPPYEPPAAGEG